MSIRRPGDTLPKDPNSVIDFVMDWSDWLGSDTISSSDWTVTTGLTEDSDAYTTTTATIWVSGGEAGTTYTLTNRIVTSSGRTADRTFYVYVKER